MKIKKLEIFPYRVFSLFVILFLIGVLFGSLVNFSWSKSWPGLFLILIGLIFTGLVNIYFKNKILVLVSWSLSFLVFGLSWYIFFDNQSKVNLPYGEIINIQGEIVKPPEKDALKQKIVIETKNYDKVTRILINAPRYPAFSYKDKVIIKGKLEKPGVIEDFDYGNYLKRYLVFGVIYQPEKVEKIGQNNSFLVQAGRMLYSIPNALEGAINWTTPEPQASLAGGILFGTKRNIPDDFKDALSKTGLTHIIALSGYNVTIIITALAVILSAYYGRKKTFWLGISVVLLFVLMTGAASSVVRAAIFSILILFGRLIGRRGDQTNLMLLAAALMILVNPYVLRYDIGFQLSFAAFIGLIYLSPVIEKLFERSVMKYVPIYVKSPLTQTLAAQIMVLPLLIIYFGRLSIISPIANVLVLWAIPYAMIFSLFDGLAGLTWWPIGRLFAYIAWPVLTYIIVITEWLAKIPLASIEARDFGWIFATIVYIIIIVGMIIISRRLRKIEIKV